jgi:hypothetical protein
MISSLGERTLTHDPYEYVYQQGRYSENVMRVVLERWGNNAVVRLPAAIVKAARFRLGQPLEVREEHHRACANPPERDRR